MKNSQQTPKEASFKPMQTKPNNNKGQATPKQLNWGKWIKKTMSFFLVLTIALLTLPHFGSTTSKQNLTSTTPIKR